MLPQISTVVVFDMFPDQPTSLCSLLHVDASNLNNVPSLIRAHFDLLCPEQVNVVNAAASAENEAHTQQAELG